MKFYKTAQAPKTFDEKMKADLSLMNRKDGVKGPARRMEDLSLIETLALINVIEEIQGIGNKIKNQRLAASFGLLAEISNIKNTVGKKFSSLNVKLPLVDSIIRLLY